MKLILLLVVGCLALHDGKGAPRTAAYKFLRCNPADGQANCVTQQSAQMPWSPELPSKLPASDTDRLDAEPVEDESPPEQDPKDQVQEDEEAPMRSEDGESPWFIPVEEGSGSEGSAADYSSFADASRVAVSETGSGESWTDSVQPKVGDLRGMKRLFPGSFLVEEAKPTEQDLEDDSLLEM